MSQCDGFEEPPETWSKCFDFWGYALKHTHDLKLGSFRFFCDRLIPFIVGAHSSLQFSHMQWDDSRDPSPCVKVYAKQPPRLIASIPYPTRDGMFTLNRVPKNMILEETILKNAPVYSEDLVKLCVKLPQSTTYDRWTLKRAGGHFTLKSFSTTHTGTLEDMLPFADQLLPHVPEDARERAWRHILTRPWPVIGSRDDLWNKRISLPHDFLSTLMIRHMKHIQRYLDKGTTPRIPRTFEYAFMTGNWGYGKTGIVQPSLGHNTLAAYSDARKVVLHVNAAQKHIETRRLLPSHYGFYCCVETTEGSTCGLVRQLAVTATISNHVPWTRIYAKLTPGDTPTFLNGLYVGERGDPPAMPMHVTVTLHDGRRDIWCDGGRLVRPVRIEGRVRFVDSLMQRYTPYEELCDYAHLGLIPATLPYSQHNQSPRSMYVTQMIKQAIMWMPETRGTSKRLWYPQRPLFDVPTVAGVPVVCGQNVVIAVLSYGGYNQEDSLIFSQRAFDLGMFRHDQFTWNRAPTDDRDLRLRETVFPKHTILERCINKTHDSVHIRRVLYEGKYVSAQTRQTRVPQQGDKFCSMHGQKGICGLVMRPENLPFTRAGVTPDVIINTHAFPSRMTIGQIIEMLTGKAALYKGDAPCAALHAAGFHSAGEERLYDGYSGVPLRNTAFIGVATYLRLKHLVDDKVHARGVDGSRNFMTNQPSEGRARGGGLRLGEMEKDTILAHGCVELLKRKFFDESDPDTIQHCGVCGAFDGHCAHKGRSRIPVSSATKLLFRELRAMHINVRYIPEPRPQCPAAGCTPEGQYAETIAVAYCPASPPHYTAYSPSDSPIYRPVSP